MSVLRWRRPTRGVHTPTSSTEERDALRESLDILTDHAVRDRLRTAVAEVDRAIAAIHAGNAAALDGLLDVRSTLTGGAR